MRRIILVSAVLAMVLAGCGAITESGTFTDVGEELPPSSADPATSAGADVAEFIVDTSGAVPGGPGIGLSDAIAAAGSTTEPTLVNGTLLMDADGTIWLCEAVTETSPPSCAEPRVRVANYPAGTADWDISTGAAIGLQQDGDVLWREAAQLYGTIEP